MSTVVAILRAIGIRFSSPATVEGDIEIGDIELKSWIDTITYLRSTIIAS